MMNNVRKVEQVSTSTKSAIGGTRMSEAATPAGAAGNRASTTRIVGGAGAVAAGLEAVNLPLLLLFVTALHGLVQRRGGAGADWSRLAVAAGATLAAVEALVMTALIAVVLAA